MRNIFVPQLGQTPWVAGLPFFMVIALASFISFFARHFTQYACIICPPSFRVYSEISRWKLNLSSLKPRFSCVTIIFDSDSQDYVATLKANWKVLNIVQLALPFCIKGKTLTVSVATLLGGMGIV